MNVNTNTKPKNSPVIEKNREGTRSGYIIFLGTYVINRENL